MKVLVVEDDPLSRKFLCRVMRERDFEVTACATAEEAMTVYHQAFFPLLFLDLFLPGIDGISFCRWVRAQKGGQDSLILIGTGSDHPEVLPMVLEAGADDYIVKPYPTEELNVRLTIAQQRVKNKEIRKTLEKNLHQEQERLRHLATHDPLTNLFNRAAFLEALQETVKTAQTGAQSALIYVDLDNFKVINDSFGHSSGDLVLVEVAALLKDCVRVQDVPGRMGGDEFAVLLQGVDLAEAKTLGEEIRLRMERLHFSHPTRPFGVVASIGLAMIDGTVPEKDVIAFADSACYSAKTQGGARVEVCDGSDDGPMTNSRLLAPRAVEIKEAIRTGAFKILFQPIVDVRTASPAFYEVLLRLPTVRELLSPRAFIPTAERFHLMPEIDRHVIAQALPYLAEYKALRLAVNLSGQSLGDQTLPAFIEASFKGAGVDPGRITFEITETAMIANISTAHNSIQRLRSSGFGFALDNFGADFSSFSFLKDFIADYLKIDGKFVRAAEKDAADWIFVELMNDVAHRLKIKSIAQFVEQEATLKSLRNIGVDFAQGFLFGQPQVRPSALERALGASPPDLWQI
jgi:diguanylate cyclase (GGDEF)-like protein